jgi:simple sugar transport system ATP-binding protein/ribose transport system ATP-binding protein
VHHDAIHLDIRSIGKSFGATRALDDVSVEVRAGSVHALVGENGAGKSTLGKIIAGVIAQDQGELVLRGTAVSFQSPRDALKAGIALVAQEVTLVPHLTVAENVYLGAEPGRGGFIDRGTMIDSFDRLAAETGFALRAHDQVGRLPLPKQQQVEILRALAREAACIVLDEPTASLSTVEVERLHEVVRALATSGRTVILVSHFLREVLDLADAVTVLRDGKVVRTGPASEATEASLIAAMLGRSMARAYPTKRPPAQDAPVAMSVRDLHAPGVRGVSIEVRAGEIVGLAGLVGAGRTELARAIYGAAPVAAGEVVVGARPLPRSPIGSIRAGVLMIPESRKDDGLLLGRPIRENVSLSSLDGLSRAGFVSRRRERERVRQVLEQAVAPTAVEAPAGALSGGNQQKLLFARALLAGPGVLLADEPTRGVDVGAKRDLYELIVELAASGLGILLISNEIEEILGLAHRVVVMRGGRVAANLADAEATESAILAAAFGTQAA